MTDTVSPARRARDAARSKKQLERYIARDDEDIRALRRLIKFYTTDKDWFMVERMFNDLGRLYVERANRKTEVFKELYGGKVNGHA